MIFFFFIFFLLILAKVLVKASDASVSFAFEQWSGTARVQNHICYSCRGRRHNI